MSKMRKREILGTGGIEDEDGRKWK
jgi:hypothetical protein